ncbi:hypothetical protein [Methanocaldococcus villosus]|uniref:hypothetical protein n=1 Tax=Methanocaldococcus villosus TaxID=667126 RepID=UPI002E82344A|nr:hypothetical protein [Methanocaldococcus villosus]
MATSKTLNKLLLNKSLKSELKILTKSSSLISLNFNSNRPVIVPTATNGNGIRVVIGLIEKLQ